MGRFRDALSQPGLGAIAEVKRRSPSAGDLRPDADPAELAAAFEGAGASAVSILVDERFAGTWDDLRAARAVASLPLLAKGFFSTREPPRDGEGERRRRGSPPASRPRRCAGARADGRRRRAWPGHPRRGARRRRARARDGARRTCDRLNARDLGTFEIDRRKQLGLVAAAPRDRIVVAESGILNRAHGAAAELAGADAVLVGSALMRAPDPAATLADLLRRPYVKVCGLTREEDVAVAAEAGADFAGFVLAESPRRAAAPLPVPETMLSVGVFVGETEEAGTDLAQLYAQENGHRARDGVLLRGDEVVAHVKDLPWLEEDDGHWEQAARAEGRVLLAGGLGPENVRAAIEAVDPWCVDASRSLEASPGIKDHDRVRAFVEAAR